MPITLGPFHFTAHRGDDLTQKQDNKVVRALTGQPKDALSAKYAEDSVLKPRAKMRGSLPTLTIKRTTDSTRYTGSRSLAKAALSIPRVVDSPEEVKSAVVMHIRNQLALRATMPTNQQLPVLIFVGGHHSYKVSLMMQLAAIAAVKDQSATVLLEEPRDIVDRLKLGAQVMSTDFSAPVGPDGEDYAAARNNIIAQHVSLPRGEKNDDLRNATTFTLTTLVAAKTGADIGHFDRLRGAHGQATARGVVDQEDRELAMISDIQAALNHATGPVVVPVGRHHLPKLHAHFDGLFDVISLSHTNHAMTEPESSDDRKRSSYVLANPGIFKLRSGPTVESTPFNALAVSHGLGLDLTRPLSSAIPAGAPWER